VIESALPFNENGNSIPEIQFFDLPRPLLPRDPGCWGSDFGRANAQTLIEKLQNKVV